ncbi:MAG: serine/threonine protein kinase [Acidimicrobiia bacterium]|nr:serine/threonine protein kinase [Acidimicrobiia bacterium]
METTHEGVLIGGRYELGPLLRRGGMADVHTGVDRRLGREVAIKLLRPDMAERDDVRVRFESEARAAARLSHPNAVSVFDTGEHDGQPYIVMERLPGRTLADVIAEGPVSWHWLEPGATGVLSALGAAHAAGIVHRDVKPGNILLTDDGTAKIADFGIAKSAEMASGTAGGTADITLTGQLVGTPAYLAPERLAGAPATFLSDLYSMGVVLYEALAAEKPFTGDSFIAVAQAVQTGAHRPLATLRPDVGPGVAGAVERALDRDPTRRFASAEEMASALRGAPDDATVIAGAVAPTGEETAVLATAGATLVGGAMPLPPAATRRRVPLRAVWAVAAVLAVVLLALLALSGGSHPKPASSTTPTTAATTPVPTTAPTAAPPTALETRTANTPARGRHHRGGKG